MAGFKGKYEHSIDDKGRVSLPAKLRKHITPDALDSFVITRGHEICLYLYPLDIWNTIETDFKTRLNVHRDQDRLFLRTIMMWAQEVSLDKQSRIMIPQELLEFAGIDSNVLIVGNLDYIEIWKPEEFFKYLDQNADKSYQEVAANVLGGSRN